MNRHQCLINELRGHACGGSNYNAVLNRAADLLEAARPITDPVTDDEIDAAFEACELIGDVISVKEMKLALEGFAAGRAAGVEDEPVAQWQKKHPYRTDGRWQNTDEHDARWWVTNSMGWEMRALYVAPQPAAVGPTAIGFMVFGGDVALPDYAGLTEYEVKRKVLDAARNEGYKGTVSGRLLDLGWHRRRMWAVARSSTLTLGAGRRLTSRAALQQPWRVSHQVGPATEAGS